MRNSANIIGWAAIFLNAGAQLFLAPVIKSNMGIAGLGVWHLVSQTFFYLQLIDFGFSNGIVREIASVPWGHVERSHYRLVKAAKFLLTAIGLLFLISGIGGTFLLPRFVKIPDPFKLDFTMAILLFAGWGIPRYYYCFSLLMLRGRNRMAEFNLLELIQSAGRPFLGILMVIAQFGMIGIVIGYVFAEAAARWISTRLVKIDTNQDPIDIAILYRMLKFGGATGAISLSTLITFYSSSFIIGWKLGVDQVAVYQSTIALPTLIMRLAIIPFSNRLALMIYQMQHENSLRYSTQTLRVHILVIILSALTLLGICLINDFFVSLWVGNELFAGFRFTAFFSLFLLLSIARHNGFMTWQAKGELKALTFAHLIDVPANIFLSVIFINHLGLTGVALAFILAAIPSIIASQYVFFILAKTNSLKKI